MSLLDDVKRPERLHEFQAWVYSERAPLLTHLPPEHLIRACHSRLELALAEYRSAWNHTWLESYPDQPSPFTAIEAPPLPAERRRPSHP